MKKQKAQPVKTMFTKPILKTAVVIPHLNEPDLPNTIASVRATFPAAVVIDVEDVFRRGPAWARNEGISQASAQGCDVVILVDAHMRFSDGALSEVADTVRGGEKRLVGAPCHHNNRCSFDGEAYHNARLTMAASNGHEQVSICAQWRRDGEPLNAVMGACYGFRIADYIAAGRPYRFLSGWGHEEETLSCCWLFMGGTIHETKKPVAHLYRDHAHLPPTAASRARTWSNRYLLVHALPIREETRRNLLQWMDSAAYVEQHRGEVMHEVDSRVPIAIDVRRRLEAFGVSEDVAFANFRTAANCGKSLQSVATETTPAEVLPVIVREKKHETCHRCGAVDSFVHMRGLVARGGYSETRIRCQSCGSKAVLRVIIE
jgi:hypothetical protein